MRIGYKLATEAFGPAELIRQAVLAEEAGFDFVEMSDHYPPVAGGAGAQRVHLERPARDRGEDHADRPGDRGDLPVGAVPPGDHRPGGGHLALVSDGRFTLGVGAGERLNEHVVGLGFPGSVCAMSGSVRRWRSSGCCGAAATSRTRASICSSRTPASSTCRTGCPVIAVAASGPVSARIAAELGDGLFATEPDGDLVAAGGNLGGSGPAYAEMPLAWAPDEDKAAQAVAGRRAGSR